MKGNELVWRVLADRAIEGQRAWANVADLAFEAGVPSPGRRETPSALSSIRAGDRTLWAGPSRHVLISVAAQSRTSEDTSSICRRRST
jgi:hypothetical protein